MGAKTQATMIARPEPDLHAVDPEIDALIVRKTSASATACA
jgi:hypothetical protein